MAYCTNCGAQVDDNAKFCGVCGNKMSAIPQQPKTNTRKTTYDGTIHKCPNCGAGLSSFVKNCPECGYELRGTDGVESVSDFARRYASATTNDKKVDLIRTFVIPNTKEDILEFAILASSNIDTTAYTKDHIIVSGGVSQQDVTEAWMAKFEQAYQKATILLSDTPDFSKIEKIYTEKKNALLSSRKKAERNKQADNRRKALKIVLPFLLGLFLMFAPISIIFGVHQAHMRKLEKMVDEVEYYIAQGDYDTALIKAEQIYDDTDWSTESEEKWDNIRESLIERINQMKGVAAGKAKMPNSNYEDQQYEDIVSLFKKAGFINVTSEKVPDLITGWIHKEGEVIEVSIDGNTSFTKGEYCDPSVSVVVRYHGFSD